MTLDPTIPPASHPLLKRRRSNGTKLPGGIGWDEIGNRLQGRKCINTPRLIYRNVPPIPPSHPVDKSRVLPDGVGTAVAVTPRNSLCACPSEIDFLLTKEASQLAPTCPARRTDFVSGEGLESP